MPINILPKSTLSKWSISCIIGIVLIVALVPILEYQVGIDFKRETLIRVILAISLAITSLGAAISGFVGLRRKKGFIYFVPLLLGFWIFIASVDMLFDTGG
ncbi:MAG: hypothetical protein PHQ86_09715 [Dehalococcoidales bacterium]|nr:hypothetical protein [Dehalococcoidales bacterium]